MRLRLIVSLQDLLTGVSDMTQGVNEKTANSVRPATILLADIRGFSQLTSSTTTETVVELLNDFYEAMVTLVDAYDGRIDKFMGDSVMAVFGLNENIYSATQNAIACAVAMQQSIVRLNKRFRDRKRPEIYVGMAINTGEVIAGEIGCDLYREFTVIGEPVNTTARVEAHSLRGQILLTEATYLLAKKFITTRMPQKVYVKGSSNPLVIYELLETRKPITMSVPRVEERRYPRVEVQIPLAFQKVAGAKVLKEEYMGEILDISYKGMKASTGVLLEPFTDIRFPFSEQLFRARYDEIYAKVLDSRPVEQGYLASLEFTSMSPNSQLALHQLVDQLLESVPNRHM